MINLIYNKLFFKDKRKFDGDLTEDNKSIKKNKFLEGKNNEKIIEIYKSKKEELEEEQKKLEAEKDSWKESMQKLQGTLAATNTST